MVKKRQLKDLRVFKISSNPRLQIHVHFLSGMILLFEKQQDKNRSQDREPRIPFSTSWHLHTDSTKINRPGHNMRMYRTNFRQPTAHVQQNIFGKTLIVVCSPRFF